MTALQEFYKELESLEGTASRDLIRIKDVKQMIGNYYLKKEKQQIAHAYELGSIEEMQETFKTGNEFYESVYE